MNRLCKLALALIWLVATTVAADIPERLPLHTGWQIQSSCKVEAKGEVISTSGFAPAGWYRATVPGGVFTNLVDENKLLSDPYFGMNLRSASGMSYPVATIFANRPMAEDSPYHCSWWYRTEFTLPAGAGVPALHFEGINYRANIWLNGRQIANAEDVAGAYRTYEFNVSGVARSGRNVLAVEVFAPTENDLGINWVDWNPTPPDKNMGLWRAVYLTFSGAVTLRAPQVVSKLKLPSLDAAELTVSAELHNTKDHVVHGILRGSIDGIRFSQPVDLAAEQTVQATFSAEKFPQLRFLKPRIWWPWQMGEPNLYKLELEFLVDGRISDRAGTSFGIREITSELNDKGYRQFKINGRNLLIRGGGWAPDMLLRENPERTEQEIRYARHMGLNTIRLEGKLETDHFFDLADRSGMLVMAGWCCCDHWELWSKWTDADRRIAPEALRSQIIRLRNHPSLLVWLNGSDNPPPADAEQSYIEVLKQTNWPNPYISSASAQSTTVTGESGVKMTGPYEYVPPVYWYADKNKYGGAWGFNTETSPGPAVPTIESLRRMMPPDDLWPINQDWSFHSGAGHFKSLDTFTTALTARYGAPTSAEDYARKSQAMTYDGERAMFEAYGRNKYSSTGVIQWMLNNAWPSMIWHLYDWYLMPGGGYFGTRKACEPLHVQYSYDDRSVVVVNSEYRPFRSLQVSAKVYDINMKERYQRGSKIDVGEDDSKVAFTLPDPASQGAGAKPISTTYFVSLDLRDESGREVSSNFYWLSTKPDVLDWDKSLSYVTPTTSQADLTGLNSLPRVRLKMTSEWEAKSEVVPEGREPSPKQPAGGRRSERIRVRLTNPSSTLAFQVRLRLTDAAGKDVLPVLWDDNFIALRPGETRDLNAEFDSRDLPKGDAQVRLEGWNVEAETQRVVQK